MSNFQDEVTQRVKENAENKELLTAANEFIQKSTTPKYCYNFSFLGRPIIQYPQDMVAVQELIWKTQPDLITVCPDGFLKRVR